MMVRHEDRQPTDGSRRAWQGVKVNPGILAGLICYAASFKVGGGLSLPFSEASVPS